MLLINKLFIARIDFGPILTAQTIVHAQRLRSGCRHEDDSLNYLLKQAGLAMEKQLKHKNWTLTVSCTVSCSRWYCWHVAGILLSVMQFPDSADDLNIKLSDQDKEALLCWTVAFIKQWSGRLIWKSRLRWSKRQTDLLPHWPYKLSCSYEAQL